VATVAHELAHVLVHTLVPSGEEPHHGPAFRRADADLVAALLGPAAADRLAGAFSAAGLALGPALVAAPPSAAGGFWTRWPAAGFAGPCPAAGLVLGPALVAAPPSAAGGFWTGWRAASVLAAAAPAPRGPIAL